MLGDHVTTDAGTGCVHTAPAHGLEDFQIGKAYDLEVYNPWAERRLSARYPVFEGKHIFKANDEIVAELEARGILCATSHLIILIRIVGAIKRRSSSVRRHSGSFPWSAKACSRRPRKRLMWSLGTDWGRAYRRHVENDLIGVSHVNVLGVRPFRYSSIKSMAACT